MYENSQADYETLLKLDNAVSIHQRNLQYLLIEICETKKSLNPSFTSEILRQEMYNMICEIRILLAFLMPRQLLMA